MLITHRFSVCGHQVHQDTKFWYWLNCLQDRAAVARRRRYEWQHPWPPCSGTGGPAGLGYQAEDLSAQTDRLWRVDREGVALGELVVLWV